MAVAAPTRFRSNRVPPDLAFGSDDDGLVARVRAGDDTAFDAIYDRYHSKLLAFCRHMVGSREEAEDVLQHTFVSAYRALRRTEEPVALRPWLYTIARNRCLSALRARTHDTDLEDAESELRTFDGLAAEVHRRSELRDLVHDIKTLPEEQRAALVLFELGDHSHEEIAHVLGVRREKVKALVFQAREGLMRARRGRDASCHEIREQLASTRGAASKRSLERLHVDRCPACAAYEADVRRQRVAIAAVLPVLPSVGLKSSVLGSILGGGGLAAAGGGAAGGGAAVVTAGGAGGAGASAGGAGIATTGALGGGATAAGAGGAAAGTAAGAAAAGTAAVGTTAGGLAAAGAGAGVVAAEVGAAGGIAGGLASLGVQGVVAKVLTVVAVAGGAGGATAHEIAERRETKPKAAEVAQQSAAPSAPAVSGASAPAVPAAPLGGLGIGALAPMPPLNLTPVVFEAPPLPGAAPDVPVPAEPGPAKSLPPAAAAPAPATGTTTESDTNVAEPIIPVDSSGQETTQPPPVGETVIETTGAPGPVVPPLAAGPSTGVTTPVAPVTPPDPTTEPTPTVPVTTPGAEQPADPVATPPDPVTEPGTTDPPPTTIQSSDAPKDEGTGMSTTPSDGGAVGPLGSTATG